MNAPALILLLTAAVACTASPSPTTIVTDFTDARATTTMLPSGHRTELVTSDARVLATLVWDDDARTATVMLPSKSKTLLIDPALVTPELAGLITYQAANVPEKPSGFEEFCVFCEATGDVGIYCYWVPFCCGWPYNTCP